MYTPPPDRTTPVILKRLAKLTVAYYGIYYVVVLLTAAGYQQAINGREPFESSFDNFNPKSGGRASRKLCKLYFMHRRLLSH